MSVAAVVTPRELFFDLVLDAISCALSEPDGTRPKRSESRRRVPQLRVAGSNPVVRFKKALLNDGFPFSTGKKRPRGEGPDRSEHELPKRHRAWTAEVGELLERAARSFAARSGAIRATRGRRAMDLSTGPAAINARAALPSIAANAGVIIRRRASPGSASTAFLAGSGLPSTGC